MMPRPSDYTDAIADRICAEISKGRPVYKIVDDDGMPCEDTVYRWINERPEFSEKYARARERRADRHADEIVEIADSEPDPAKARNRMDARKWAASKFAPKKYGDKMDLSHSGELTVEIVKLARVAKEGFLG